MDRQLAGHDAGRLRLLNRMIERLDLPDPARALDTLWLVTGFAAYDDLTRGRGLSTARAAELLSGLAERALAAQAKAETARAETAPAGRAPRPPAD